MNNYIIDPEILSGASQALAMSRWNYRGHPYLLFDQAAMNQVVELEAGRFAFQYSPTNSEGVLMAYNADLEDGPDEEDYDDDPDEYDPDCGCEMCRAHRENLGEENPPVSPPAPDPGIFGTFTTATTDAAILDPPIPEPAPEAPRGPPRRNLGDNVFVEGNWNGSLVPDDFRAAIVNHVRPVMGDRKIVVSVPHHRPSPPNENDDEFHIKIWSALESQEELNPVMPAGTVFGVGRLCGDGSRLALIRQEGFQDLYAPAEGKIVGAFSKNDLYIYYDAVHLGSANEVRALEEIFSEMAAIIEQEGETDMAKVLKSAETSLNGMVHQGSLAQITNLEQQLRVTTQQTDNTVRQLDGLLIRKMQLGEELRAYKEASSSIDIPSILEGLANLDYVAKVQGLRQRITVDTKMLTCGDRLLGRLRFTFTANGYHLDNLSWHVIANGFHVILPDGTYQNNQSWVGRGEATQAENIAGFRIDKVLDTVVRYITNPKMMEAGQFLSCFPLTPEALKKADAEQVKAFKAQANKRVKLVLMEDELPKKPVRKKAVAKKKASSKKKAARKKAPAKKAARKKAPRKKAATRRRSAATTIP